MIPPFTEGWLPSKCKEFHAICNMRVKYGGVARKQAIPEINGIYNEKIEYLCSLIGSVKSYAQIRLQALAE